MAGSSRGFVPAQGRPGPTTSDLAAFLAGFVFLALAWLWLQRSVFVLQPGDEGIYVYDSLLASRGTVPYLDFFLAHPPLRIVIGAAMLALGAPMVAVKSLAPLAGIGAAFFAGLTVLAGTRGRAGWALLASFLLLFASQSFQALGSWAGVETGMFLVALAVHALSRRRFKMAGAVSAVATWQCLHALVPVPVLALWAWRERGLGPFLGGLAIGPVLHGLTYALCGEAYVDQVFLYHLRKVGTDPYAQPMERLLAFLYGDVGLIAFAFAGLLPQDSTSRWAAIGGLACVAVVAVYSSLMTYYFIIAFPLLAIASAFGLRHLHGLVPIRGLGWVVLVVVLTVTYLPHVSGALGLEQVRTREAQAVDALAGRLGRCRPESGEIWGTSSLVPLLALRTGLTVAAMEVDTDDKRFTSGTSDIGAVLDRVFAGPPPMVVLALDGGLDLVAGVRERIRRELVPAFRWDLTPAGLRGIAFAQDREAARIGECVSSPEVVPAVRGRDDGGP